MGRSPSHCVVLLPTGENPGHGPIWTPQPAHCTTQWLGSVIWHTHQIKVYMTRGKHITFDTHNIFGTHSIYDTYNMFSTVTADTIVCRVLAQTIDKTEHIWRAQNM